MLGHPGPAALLRRPAQRRGHRGVEGVDGAIWRQKSRWGGPPEEFVPGVHLPLPDNPRAMTQTILLHRIAVFSVETARRAAPAALTQDARHRFGAPLTPLPVAQPRRSFP